MGYGSTRLRYRYTAVVPVQLYRYRYWYEGKLVRVLDLATIYSVALQIDLYYDSTGTTRTASPPCSSCSRSL
eukprot:COSAG01_NODE_1836_length_9084_cov_5.216472_5_plen_72_part_00